MGTSVTLRACVTAVGQGLREAEGSTARGLWNAGPSLLAAVAGVTAPGPRGALGPSQLNAALPSAAAATPGLLENKVSPMTCVPSHRCPQPCLTCVLFPQDSSVIYSQVKVTSTPGSRPQRSAPSAPHR